MSNLREPVFYERIWNIWKRYGPGTFVETGTGPFPHCGLAVAYALEMRTFSCDVNPTFVRSATLRYPGSRVYAGLSTDALPVMCDEAGDGRTLFFLDAHFGHLADYANAAPGATAPQWPVMEELRLIKAHKVNVANDLILCDDIRCIADEENPMYDPAIETSELAQRQYRFRDYLEVFVATHNVSLWPEFEGILCFWPKEK